jgi:hypothetical protein
MTDTISKRDFLIALAEGKAVKIGNYDYYRLQDNRIQRNSEYSGGNWHDVSCVTPLLLDGGIAIEKCHEHYYPMDTYDAIKCLLSGGMVTDKIGNTYAIDNCGDLVRFPGYALVKLGELKGKRFYKNECRLIQLSHEEQGRFTGQLEDCKEWDELFKPKEGQP